VRRAFIALCLCACSAPATSDAGFVRVTVAAQIAGAQITEVSVNVTPANTAAVLTRRADGTFEGTVEVPAGVAQTVTAKAFAGSVLAASGTGTATVLKGQVFQLTIIALDTTGPAPRPDHSPVITSLAAAVAVAPGEQVALSATAIDADGDVLTYAWSAAPAGCGTFAAASSSSTAWTAGTTGICAITIKVSARSLSDTRSANILVRAPGGTPTLVQHTSSSSNEQNGLPGNDFRFTLPNPVLAGNCLILGVTFGAATFSASTAITSIRDSSGDAWTTTPVITASDGAKAKSAIFVLPNATAAIHTVTVTLNVKVTLFQYTVSEFSGVDSAHPVNGATGQAAAISGGAVSTGSFTPGNNDANGGNLIWAYFADDFTPFATVPTAYAANAPFTLLDGSIGTNASQLPHGSMYFVQTTAAPISPAMTLTGGRTDVWNGVAVALKASGAGTTPSGGIRIRSLIHETAAQPPTTWAMQFPSAGSLLVIRVNGDPNLSTITDSNGNGYTRAVGPAGSVEPQIWYAQNAKPGIGLKVTLQFSASPGNRTVLLYDVIGAATSSVVDGKQDNGDQAAPATALAFTLDNSPTITPGSANGLTIAGIGLGIGPVDAIVTPAGAIMDFVYYTFDEDSDRMDSGDGAGHLFNTDTAPEDWSWHIPNVGSNGSCGSVSACSSFGGSAVHFRAAPPGP